MKNLFVASVAFFLVLALLVMISNKPAAAEKMPVVESTVVDIDGNPVEGAFIFFYDSPDTRRAVDLVSPSTDKNGDSVKEVPPGMYWALARLKKEGDFDMGPLMIGDKVSSDPLEIDVKPGDRVSVEFTVMNLLDTVNASTKKRTDLNRISGTIATSRGEVPAAAFVFANRHDQSVSMPSFFSAWADGNGRFSMYLPNGSYYLGGAVTFGPDQKYMADTAITVEGDMKDLRVVLKEMVEQETVR